MEDVRNAHKIFVGKPGRSRPLGRPGRTWKDSIEVVIKEIVINGVDWIKVAQARVQWLDVVNTMVPYLLKVLY